MFRKIGFFIIAASLIANVQVSASTAGNIEYDAQGKLVPVQDPVIMGMSTIIPDEIKKLPKKIVVDLSEQTLSYYYGNEYIVDEFKISSGLMKTPTPTGTFNILGKIPIKEYSGRNTNGSFYYLPNTKWNLQFSVRGYYIHGTYWHNNFGRPMSHGCVNVSYADMENLYAFADVGTKVVIQK